MGRAGRLRKPKLSGGHERLNEALHELHKGAGLMPLSAMARTLDGAGISRSTIYDAFSSTRLPSWEVVESLVEALATKHPQTSPEKTSPRFYELWLHAVDEESEDPSEPDRSFIKFSNPTFEGPRTQLDGWDVEGSLEPLRRLADPRPDGEVVWLSVPFGDKERVKALGARWDNRRRLWYARNPGPELMQWRYYGTEGTTP